MAEREQTMDESAGDYASTEWLWCCGEAEDDNESEFRSKKFDETGKQEPNQQINELSKAKRAEGRYARSSRDIEDCKKNPSERQDKENDVPYHSSYLSSYESRNNYLMRQNHDSKSMNFDSFQIIAKLREDRNQLVREGEIRHRSFKEAHSQILKKSESKRKEMSTISTEDLKNLIVDRIMKTQRKQECSSLSLIADLNNNSKAKSTSKPTQHDNDDYDFHGNYEVDFKTGIKPRTEDFCTERSEDKDARILAELKFQNSDFIRLGRDVHFDEICYTKSKQGLTDRDHFMETVDERSHLPEQIVERPIEIEEAHMHEPGMPIFEASLYYGNRVDNPLKEERLKEEISIREAQLIEPLEMQCHHDACYQVDELMEKQSDTQSHMKKTESSFEKKINQDLGRYQGLEYTSEMYQGELYSSILSDKGAGMNQLKSKSARSRLLMDSFAQKMEFLTKRLEILKTSSDYQDGEQLVVDTKADQHEASHQISLPNHEWNTDIKQNLQQEELVAEESPLPNQIEQSFLRNISTSNLENTQEQVQDKEGESELEDIDEPLVQETSICSENENIQTHRLRASDLMIMTIQETFEENSTLRGEEQYARLPCLPSKSVRSLKDAEEDEMESSTKNLQEEFLKSYKFVADHAISQLGIESSTIELVEECHVSFAKISSPTLSYQISIEPKNTICFIEYFQRIEKQPCLDTKAIEPSFEKVETGYQYNLLSNNMFNNTLSSSQFMFDNQAEIFGQDEAHEEHLFQGFLNADCLIEELEKERLSVGFERKTFNQTRKLVKRYAQDQYTAKGSRRLSGSRYILNTSKGQLKAFSTTLQDDSSIVGIKRTLHTEFDKAQGEDKVHKLFTENNKNNIERSSYRTPSNASMDKAPENDEKDAQHESVQQIVICGVTSLPKTTSEVKELIVSESSPVRNSETKSAYPADPYAELHKSNKSINLSKSSFKKGIYKLIASSKKDADVSDYLYIDQQLDEIGKECNFRYEEKDPQVKEETTNIIRGHTFKDIERIVSTKFEPLKSQEFSSYCGESNYSEKRNSVKMSDLNSEVRKRTDTRLQLKLSKGVENPYCRAHEDSQKQLCEINKKLEEIRESINAVGITGLNLFTRIRIKAEPLNNKEHKRYSSSSLTNERRSSFISTHKYFSRDVDLENLSNSKPRRPQFTAFERWFAKEKDIDLNTVVSQSHFRGLCLKSSQKDREKRAPILYSTAFVEENKNNNKHDMSHNDSCLSAGEIDAKFFENLDLLPVYNEQTRNEQPSFSKNQITTIFLMLLSFEKETRKVLKLLDICPGFNIMDFMQMCFLNFGRRQASEDYLTLHKNAMFKILRKIGSQCPGRVFDLYWGLKFGKENINKTQFSRVFFLTEPPQQSLLSIHGFGLQELSEYSDTIRNLLALLFDLSVKCEVYFHQAKTKASLPAIIDFVKQLSQGEKTFIVLKDLLKSEIFKDFTKDELTGIGRRLTLASKSESITAYNICLMMA